MSAEEESVNRDTENLLQAFAPARPRIDRDRLMFEAGANVGRLSESSARRSKRIWQSIAGAMTTTAAALAVTLVVREPAERIVYVDRPAPPTVAVDVAPAPTPLTKQSPDDSIAAPSNNWLQLREVALSDNWRTENETPHAAPKLIADPPATFNSLQRRYLEQPAGSVFPAAGRM